jgi:ribosomal protein L16 Arg81 hydroxylase
VSQFVKGLRSDIHAVVESQVPETVERAILLALVQQEVLAETKPWAQRQHQVARGDYAVAKPDTVKPHLKLGNGDMWKDRQLRLFRRANRLCFHCGEKYDPAHQCNKKATTELHALTTEVTPELLSDEALNMMEQQDLAEAQQLSLSIHALAGTKSD